jgi:hypothetical protein
MNSSRSPSLGQSQRLSNALIARVGSPSIKRQSSLIKILDQCKSRNSIDQQSYKLLISKISVLLKAKQIIDEGKMELEKKQNGKDECILTGESRLSPLIIEVSHDMDQASSQKTISNFDLKPIYLLKNNLGVNCPPVIDSDDIKNLKSVIEELNARLELKCFEVTDISNKLVSLGKECIAKDSEIKLLKKELSHKVKGLEVHEKTINTLKEKILTIKAANNLRASIQLPKKPDLVYTCIKPCSFASPQYNGEIGGQMIGESLVKTVYKNANRISIIPVKPVQSPLMSAKEKIKNMMVKTQESSSKGITSKRVKETFIFNKCMPNSLSPKGKKVENLRHFSPLIKRQTSLITSQTKKSSSNPKILCPIINKNDTSRIKRFEVSRKIDPSKKQVEIPSLTNEHKASEIEDEKRRLIEELNLEKQRIQSEFDNRLSELNKSFEIRLADQQSFLKAEFCNDVKLIKHKQMLLEEENRFLKKTIEPKNKNDAELQTEAPINLQYSVTSDQEAELIRLKNVFREKDEEARKYRELFINSRDEIQKKEKVFNKIKRKTSTIIAQRGDIIDEMSTNIDIFGSFIETMKKAQKVDYE